MPDNLNPIVTHRKSREGYLYKGENIFENLITGKSGEVSDELASKIFLFDVRLTQMGHDYPNVLDLIKKLSLRIK